MFYVRLRTMTKNRVVTGFDRYPEQTAQLKKLGDLFGKAGRKQLAQVGVSQIDRIQIDRSLAFIGDINERIKQSEATIRAMTKANANVKLLKTIPGIGEFFARLIDAEIDDIARFRTPKKLAAYAGLVPSTYSSGGKTYHGKIIKQGNKWLRWAFVEAVAPATSDPQLRAQIPKSKAADLRRKVKQLTGRNTSSSLGNKLKEINPILRGWANYYRHCAYAGRVFTSLDWYTGMRIWRWLRKKRPKARERDLWEAHQPSSRRTTRRLWREGPIEQHLLAWTPVCRFRLAWMEKPDFAVSSGEPDA
jgi:hypothetical protein